MTWSELKFLVLMIAAVALLGAVAWIRGGLDD